jgi:preprotein translocase subunit YajC
MIRALPNLSGHSLVLTQQDPTQSGGEAPPVFTRQDGPAPADATGTTAAPGGASPQGQQDVGACIEGQLPILIGFVAIFYFLILRPQQKADRQRKELLASIKKGDRVVTSAGMHGQITQLTDETVTLEVADGVRLTFDRSSVSKVLGGGSSDAAKPAKGS